MKNILLLVHDDDGQEARLQAALDLTRALGGHLSCVDVAVLPELAGGDYDGMCTTILLQDERERESHNKAVLGERLAREDVLWDWVDVTNSLADAVIEAALLADLIVLNRKLDAFPCPNMRDVAIRVLMHARKPIVAVPDSSRHFALGRALVAWDGQDSAAAAMRACVPLLKQADEVEIFMVGDGNERIETRQAAQYLSRHGIHATMRVTEDELAPADQLIAAECARFAADYVIMGAYGHGRLREAFGGVTKRMLDTSVVPLILGH